MGLGTFDTYRPTETVDELATATDMMGPESYANQKSAAAEWWHDPTKSLIALWVIALLLYWAMGYFFRGVRA